MKFIKFYIITYLFLLLLAPIKAQQNGDSLAMTPIILGDILITANNNDLLHSTVAKNQIQNYNQVKNVADLFKEINGFSLVKRSAYAIDPVLRGFKYNQLNIQYDGGTKANHACPNRMDPATTFVIPEEVEKIEVIKGPFSTRYGVNFGGVVNLVTSRELGDNPIGSHGFLLAGYETNGSSWTTSGGYSYGVEKYNFLVNGSVRDYGNYKDGEGTVVPSSFKSYDYSIKSGYNIKQNQRVQANFHQSFGRDIMHAGLPMDTDYDNSTIASIDYKWQDIAPKIYSLTAKLYYNNVDHLMNNIHRKNYKIVTALTPVTSNTYGGRFEMQFIPFENNVFYGGLDISNLARQGVRNRTVKRNPKNPEIVFETPKIFIDSIWQDSKINTIGIFGDGKQFFTNSKLSYGLRVDFVKAAADNPVKEFQNEYSNLDDIRDINFSGYLSFAYDINTHNRIGISAGRGVRSPSMEERFIYHLGINQDPYEYVGNPSLLPEANNQVELSYAGNINKVQYGFSMYYSYVTNYITAKVDSTVKRKFLPFKEPKFAKVFENIDKASLKGIEAYVELPMGKTWKIVGDMAYTYGENLSWDEPLPQIAPLRFGLDLKYTTKRFWSELSTQIVSSQKRISASFGEQESPSHTVVDFKIGFRPIPKVTLAVTVLNVMDTYYYNHLNFSYVNSSTLEGEIYQPGRNFNIFFRYDF